VKRFAFVAFVFFSLLFSASANADSAKSELVVGLTGKYPPFNYFDASGKLTGFDVEVAEEICRRTHKKCVFRVLQWDGILASLLAGKIDAIIGSMAITEERAAMAAFSTPYYESGAQLFVKPEGKAPKTAGFRVGVTLGTTYESFVRKALPEAEVVTYKGDPEIFQDIRAGRLDGMVTDKLAGAYLNRTYEAGLLLAGEPLFVERIAIPVRPERTALLAEINDAVNALRASPAYASLMEKYFGLGSISKGDSKGETNAEPSFRLGSSLTLMLRGLFATARVSLAGLGLGALLAFVLSFGLIGLPGLARKALLGYVDFIRATPFMIQLFAIYFGLPAVGLKLSAWTSAVLAIGIHSSAYLSEIIKAAYLSVPSGQRQAALTLGLSKKEALVHVIFPQMLPVMSAPVLNTVVAMIKDSAIVSVISVYELTMQAQQLISVTFRPLEFYLGAALLYALLTYPLLILGRIQERRFSKKGLFHEGA